jgi:GT2 family glycosyltransferase
MRLSGQAKQGASNGRDADATPRLLSIVVVSYNCAGHLASCLSSLEQQRRRLPLEVIVVDNSSTDGTLTMVRERFPWVVLMASDDNRGFAWASNRGMERARGDYLLLLNPDTVVEGDALRSAVQELVARPEVGMLGCKLVRPDGVLDHACKRGFPTPVSSLYYFSGLSRLAPRSRRFAQYTAGHLDPDQEGFVDAVNGAFMLVRRAAVRAVGPMDEDYWLYMEDLDWCYRFWQKGWPVLYWPEVTVTHVKGGSSGKHRTWRTNYAFHRGMWLFYRKHYLRPRSVPVAGLVWLAVWAKLGVSALRSSLARQRLTPSRTGGMKAS